MFDIQTMKSFTKVKSSKMTFNGHSRSLKIVSLRISCMNSYHSAL